MPQQIVPTEGPDKMEELHKSEAMDIAAVPKKLESDVSEKTARELVAEPEMDIENTYAKLNCQTVYVQFVTPYLNPLSSIRFAASVLDPAKAKFGKRLVFFTDGSFARRSCTGDAGIAFKRLPAYSQPQVDFPWIGTCFAIGKVTNCVQCEDVAVSKALELAAFELQASRRFPLPPRDEIYDKPHVYIFTDSQTTLIRISRFLKTRTHNRNQPKFIEPDFVSILGHLDNLVNAGVQIELYWVKGHSGSIGNMLADSLASRASIFAMKRAWTSKPGEPHPTMEVRLGPAERQKPEELQEPAKPQEAEKPAHQSKKRKAGSVDKTAKEQLQEKKRARRALEGLDAANSNEDGSNSDPEKREITAERDEAPQTREPDQEDNIEDGRSLPEEMLPPKDPDEVTPPEKRITLVETEDGTFIEEKLSTKDPVEVIPTAKRITLVETEEGTFVEE